MQYEAYLQGEEGWTEITLKVTECDPTESLIDVCIPITLEMVNKMLLTEKSIYVRFVANK